jgi:phage tail-like protein
MAITSNNRATGPGKFGIEIEGVNAGWTSGEVDGGHAVGDVITEKLGADHLQKKHLGNVKYEDISFKCGTGMSKALYQWIQTGFNQTHIKAGRKDGAVIVANYDYEEIERLNFFHAMISEFGMPALDAASKDAAKMSLKFSPEYTRKQTGGGGKIKANIDTKKQKMWTCANFRLRIDAINENDIKRVNKIEALTVKQKITEHAMGEFRDYEKEPIGVEVPNLVLTVADSHAKDFYDWHEKFVIKGECGEEAERGGSLEYLTPDLKTTLFTLKFFHLGIFKISPEKVESGQESIRRAKVEMYCEDIQFDFNQQAFFA